MKPKDLLVLAIALLLLSTLIGAAILIYLSRNPVERTPAAIATPTTSQKTEYTPDGTSTPGRPSPTPAPDHLPSLVTPTCTSTATSTSTPAPTATPTSTWTPTWTPSPTPEPAARLANAHRARRNGDYRQAISEFQIVLETPDAEWEAVEAAYQLGVCAYLDGDAPNAQAYLESFILRYPDDQRVNAAHFYLAQTFDNLRQYKAAIEQYTTYLAGQDILADLIYRRIGDDQAALGEYEAAIAAYKLALGQTLDLGQQYDVQETIGLTCNAWGRYDEAIHWFRSVIDRSENVYRLARLWYLIGQTHRLAGREPEARNAFAQAVNGDPRPGYAHLALVELVNAGVQINEYQRGLIDYHAGSYAAAIAAFDRYIESTPNYNSDVHYYIAKSHLNTGADALAIRECEQMIREYPPTAPHWGNMWLLKGRALYNLGQVDQATQTYLDFATQYPDHPLAAQARWNAAWMLEREERFAQAANVYTDLANEHPNDEQAPPARFQAGICRYRIDDLDAALQDWQTLIDAYPASDQALRAQYWRGKVLWQRGEAEQARALLQTLAETHPRNYYGLRAAHLLENDGAPVAWPKTPPRLHLTFDEPEQAQAAASWLRTWAGLPENQDPTTISDTLAQDIRFRRGMEQWSLGLYTHARDEFESLRKDLNQDPLQLYQLAFLTRDLGLYATSLRATINVVVLAPEAAILDMPTLVQRMAFPTYFSDLVLAESASQNIDPLLMFALIRQESVFDDQVESWAGAIGLTQIIPDTGQWIAEMMPWPEYNTSLLRRPYLNIHFGVWFMQRILKQTKQDVMSALAGYNGGPRNGAHWLEQSHGDPDLLVEIINYDEPQNYVRQIYRHYDMYVRLYGETDR